MKNVENRAIPAILELGRWWHSLWHFWCPNYKARIPTTSFPSCSKQCTAHLTMHYTKTRPAVILTVMWCPLEILTPFSFSERLQIHFLTSVKLASPFWSLCMTLSEFHLRIHHETFWSKNAILAKKSSKLYGYSGSMLVPQFPKCDKNVKKKSQKCDKRL